MKNKSVLIFGDSLGAPTLLKKIPSKFVAGLVCAVNRPQYHLELKKLCLSKGIDFLVQPFISSKEYLSFITKVKKISPLLIWVNSYSMKLHNELLSIPKYGCVNIHSGPLPEYRGCNPMQWAIINKESFAGVTLHLMDTNFDTGPIIDKRIVDILFQDTWLDLRTRINNETGGLISDNLDSIMNGDFIAKPQNSNSATYYPRRTADDGLFSWDQPLIDIYNMIRALVTPHPGAFYLSKNKEKIYLNNFLHISEVACMKYEFISKKAFRFSDFWLMPIKTINEVSLEFLIHSKNTQILHIKIDSINWRYKKANISFLNSFDSINNKVIKKLCEELLENELQLSVGKFL